MESVDQQIICGGQEALHRIFSGCFGAVDVDLEVEPKIEGRILAWSGFSNNRYLDSVWLRERGGLVGTEPG